MRKLNYVNQAISQDRQQIYINLANFDTKMRQQIHDTLVSANYQPDTKHLHRIYYSSTYFHPPTMPPTAYDW